ncbi:50S ribosomal protein L25 [Chloroflexota bacterium]
MQIELQATTRDILGKKVRFLRRQGIVPVHLFGPGIESVSLQCGAEELQGVLAQAGKTTLIRLKVDKGRRPRNVLIREVQRNIHRGGLLHVDLYQVNMEEKVKVEVPINLIGEAPALKSKDNMLIHSVSHLTIECLPDEIPPSIDVDLSSLTEVEQDIRVSDINLDNKIDVLDDPEQIIAKISARFVERAEEPLEEEEALEVEQAATEASSSEDQQTQE